MSSDRDKLIAKALRGADFHDRFGKGNETAILLRALVAELVRDTPRVVSTVAELDALPQGSVILTARSGPYIIPDQRNYDLLDGTRWAPDDKTPLIPIKEAWLPATVLFTPTSKEN